MHAQLDKLVDVLLILGAGQYGLSSFTLATLCGGTAVASTGAAGGAK